MSNRVKKTNEHIKTFLIKVTVSVPDPSEEFIKCASFTSMGARSGQNCLYYIVYPELFCSITVINSLHVNPIFKPGFFWLSMTGGVDSTPPPENNVTVELGQ